MRPPQSTLATFTLAVLLLAGGWSQLAAQATPLEPGTRVRLLVTADRPEDRGRPHEVRGRVVRHAPDTLVVEVHGALPPLPVPLTWVERVEISRGRASAAVGALRGGTAGLTLGALIGGAVGAELAAMGEESFFRAVPRRAALYGLAGGLSAAVAGALSPGERWERVRISALRVHGSAAGLVLSFPIR